MKAFRPFEPNRSTDRGSKESEHAVCNGIDGMFAGTANEALSGAIDRRRQAIAADYRVWGPVTQSRLLEKPPQRRLPINGNSGHA